MRFRLALSSLIATAALGQTGGLETYSFLLSGNAAGKCIQTVAANGTVEIQFSFNDRGRGPEIHGRYRFDDRGFPTLVEITGKDYFKAPVDERLTVTDGEARWKSTTEQGSAAASGFYISAGGPPVEEGWLVSAILKSPNGAVKLLPGGEARVEKGLQTKVARGGRTVALTQYLVTGLGFVPDSVWMDSDNRFFASVSSWSAVIREGWEPAADELVKLQDQVEDKRYRDMAQRLSRRPKSLAIRHVRLFDSLTATAKEGQTVVIAGDRIQTVGPDAEVTPPAAAEIVDGSGQTLLPGLWDMHVHTGPTTGLLNIASGVTSVRDMANDIDMLGRLRKQYDSGEAIGPRIFPCGFIDGRGPFQGPTKIFADTLDEARTAIDQYAALGYRQIKVYSSLKTELVAPIAAMAHAHGMRLSGHVPNGMTAEQFIRGGADELQHINFVFLNFMAEKAGDTRTPARFTVVAENAAGLDQQSPAVAAFIQLMRERHTVVDPTLGVFESMFTDRPGRVSDSWQPVVSRLPVQIQRGARAGGLPVAGAKDALYKDSFAAVLKMTKRLYDAGVPLVAGTDSVEGLMLHRELELWVQAGIPAANVLQAATIGAARVAKQDGELGSIEPGKKADLLLVAGNPIANIGDIRKGRVVIKDGVQYDCAALYAALGIAP
jgi:imidazolonepropionase-like amidohydrolase